MSEAFIGLTHPVWVRWPVRDRGAFPGAVRRSGREILQNVGARMRLLARRNGPIRRKYMIFQDRSAIRACRVAALTASISQG